jgi:curved DNA-binding protein CbpA
LYPSLSFAAVRVPNEPPPSRFPVVSDRPNPVADHEPRRIEVREFGQRIEQLDYFQMLGIPCDASTQDVDLAFMALAKVWHPDRLPSALADLTDICTHIISRLNDAHHTLRDPAARAHYLLMVRQGAGAPSAQDYVRRVLEASQLFQKAEALAKHEDYKRAEQLCRDAHQADPTQADYLALLAWIEAMHPGSQTPEATLDKVSILDRAIAVSDRCERAFYYRGMLYKRLGDPYLALADFRKAVALNPRATDAQSEARVLVSRYGSRPPRKGPTDPPRRPSGLSKKTDPTK